MTSVYRTSLNLVARLRALKYIALSVVLALCTLAILTFLDVSLHNSKLSQLAQNLAALEHPPRTALVFRNKLFGLLDEGSPYACGYFVGEMRTYEGDSDEVRRFYAGQTVAAIEWPLWSSVNQAPADLLVKLVSIEDGPLENEENARLPNALQSAGAWSLTSWKGTTRLYIIYVWQSDIYDVSLDPRCP